ncbi:MAG: PepSY domain-containing protein [Rhodocyclales bacterium]|nr:PepSY domain-containing protein [Rhodocyclales bacterium]
MRISHLLAGIVLCCGLAPAFADDGAPLPGSETRPPLTIPQIYDRLVALGYWNIDKIEREPQSFEVRASARNGERVKLYVDARSGDIVDSRPAARRRNANDAARGVECNERRCRDDLPPAGAAPLPHEPGRQGR